MVKWYVLFGLITLFCFLLGWLTLNIFLLEGEEVKLLQEKITGKIILINIVWFFIIRARKWITRENKRISDI